MTLIVLIVGIVLSFMLYVWQEWRIPKRGDVAAIERRYGKQLKRLADYAYDYEHVYDVERPDSEGIKRLFGDAAIIEAAVYSSNSLNKGGIEIKPVETSTVGTVCLFKHTPSLGKPVVNLWQGGGRQFVQYSATLLDRNGVERSYTIVFDLSKMVEPDD